MRIDFEKQFGVNAGYVETLFAQWQSAPEELDPEWRSFFERLEPAKAPAGPPAAADEDAEDAEIEALRGIAAVIAGNMNASLEVPTATSVRTLPVKVLDENRRILNAHMKVRALGKASYTHVLAYAMARALHEMPEVQSRYEERDGKPFRVTPRRVNLGLAVDVKTGGGRTLMVPNIKDAGGLDFKAFYRAYEDIVARARAGSLATEDFRGTTATLTNPGGFGTELSVPRLMQGQGLIVATGTIGVPVQARGMAAAALAEMAVGPVMTITSTYDHRVIQGAQSGLMLKRLEELLDGADGFWEDIFRVMRVAWTPWRPAEDSEEAEDEMSAAHKQVQVWMMINAYRVRGCHLADLDPLEYRPDRLPSLDPSWYGLTIWDLDRQFPAGGLCPQPRATLREILEVLRDTYCRRWTLEYMHISDRVRKHWIRARVEQRADEEVFDHEHRVRILQRLIRAENFERFLHTRYPGNKRFSLEGGDTLVPALAEVIDRAAEAGVERVILGMAHRGRLNVLANILNKSYQRIFSEFEGVLLPRSAEGSGDVKYHLGQRGRYTTPAGKQVEVLLSANPSHLEAVDPVVAGMARAHQDEDGDADRRRTLAVLVHGDAAFTGQGVVAETLQMSNLPGYSCGGTVHLVLNNQIGFTTGPRDLHSTYYCTDIAKMVQAPVLHANGDYPESVMRAVHVAVDFQREFGRDVVIDMVCYRRRGHNEGDEPAFTQPLLYRKIADHPTVRRNYIDLLVRRGQLTAEECDALGDQFDAELRAALDASRSEPEPELPVDEVLDLEDDDPRDFQDQDSPETGVAVEEQVGIIDRTNAMPEGHVVHPNLLRQLRRREEMVRGGRGLDWGCAETLAYGSLLEAGVCVRLCGQDSGRGTFSHRHAVIRDQQTGTDHVPLAHLGAASFEVRDSLLSEEAALAFEYGYALARPGTFVLWEAQFGDFVNGAQVPVDQFLAAGEAKWRQLGGVTLLLPHGYDGQGPEHSSGRIERFLQLASQGNLAVANCSTAASFFHLLRRQGLADPKRPLVIFTPKSLLRDKRAASPREDLARGRFLEVIPDPLERASGSSVERLVLCSGKVFHDLQDLRVAGAHEEAALVRLEQLYPFPRKAVLEQIGRHPGAELVWAQEEPRNMGAWSFVRQRLADLGCEVVYAGRPDSPSPATGSYKRHLAEQDYLLRLALGVPQPA